MNKKTIFWNVDTQYDFMREDGKLNVKDAVLIEPNLERLTLYAENNNLKVVNTGDWHNDETAEIEVNPNYMTTFNEHCMQYTKGAEFVPATNPKDPYVLDWNAGNIDVNQVLDNRNIVLYKDEFNIFGNNGNKYADQILDILNPENVVVYGVATNVCVDQAVNGLLDRGKNVYVPLDAIKELPNLPLEETLDAWQKKGAVLTTVDEIVKNCYL
jgi:nicotinamidase/pyrazinamidase